MAEVVYDLNNDEKLVVHLREPHWAALLAWLWPGAGHFYQRRFAKGFLFMICILSIFFLGIFWGTSRVVYASTRPADFRWQFIGQIGVGLPAFPALIQAMVAKENSDPLWTIAERYPMNRVIVDNRPLLRPDENSFHRLKNESPLKPNQKSYKDGFMAAPAYVNANDNDVLSMWHIELGHFFEIGTLYTLVAGLLNFLAIYDAYVGPFIATPQDDDYQEETN